MIRMNWRSLANISIQTNPQQRIYFFTRFKRAGPPPVALVMTCWILPSRMIQVIAIPFA